MEQDLRQAILEYYGVIFLVYSEYVGVVDAKLKVYKKYREIIDEYDIHLQHAFEEFDEIAKSVALRRVSQCCMLITDMFKLQFVSNMEPQEITDFANTLTQDDIMKLCYEVHIVYKNKSVGTVQSGTYNCYSTFTVRSIKHILAKETLEKTAKRLGSVICTGIHQYNDYRIRTKLFQELGTIRLQISDDIYHQIENTIIVALLAFFDTLSGVITDIFTFIVRIFHPVDVNSKEWRAKVAEEIYQKILEKRQEIEAHVLEAIRNFDSVEKADLEVVQRKIERFLRKIYQSDHKQLQGQYLFLLRNLFLTSQYTFPDAIKIQQTMSRSEFLFNISYNDNSLC